MDISKFKTSWDFIPPPGYYTSFVGSESDKRAVRVSIYDNHRFLFYALVDCESNMSLDLVTIDYHQDLAPINDFEREDLQSLNWEDRKEVAFFCWNHLNPLNDSQILSAMYLGLIRNVYLLTKEKQDDLTSFEDIEGQVHEINISYDFKSFIDSLKTISFNVALDIDLDFFVDRRQDGSVQYDGDLSKFSLLDSRGELMQKLYGRLDLISIAREPQHCGGVSISNEIYNNVENKLFTGQVIKFDIKCDTKLRIYDRKKE